MEKEKIEEKETKKKATSKKTTTTKHKSTTKKTNNTTKKEKKEKEDIIKPFIEKDKVMPYIDTTVEEEEKKESTPVEELEENTPIEETKENIPVEEGKDEIPADEAVDTTSIEEEKEEFPVEDKIEDDSVSEVIVKKKKVNIGILLLIILFLFLMVLVWYLALHTQKSTQGNFTEIGTFNEKMLSTNYIIIKDESQLDYYFPTKSFKGLNFDQYVYAVFEIDVDTCSESNFNPVGYQLDGTTVKVKMEYKASCGVCAPEYLYYLLELDRNYQYDDLDVEYKATNNPHCDPNVVYKPMIYLYPEEKTEVSVTLGKEDILAVTYPDYQNGWKVVAYPDGTLKMQDREYYGLFWEGNEHPSYVHEEGFVVKGEDTVSFLEKELKILGLTDKEANEFIVYWYPKLKVNPYNYIYFETEEEINDYMSLTIQPTPDHVIRIQMDYKPLEKPISVKEQTFTTPTRKGFVVVEWGGSIIKD